MKTCKSGSEGVSVKPDVEIHQGARLLPYKGTWQGSEASYSSDPSEKAALRQCHHLLAERARQTSFADTFLSSVILFVFAASADEEDQTHTVSPYGAVVCCVR